MKVSEETRSIIREKYLQYRQAGYAKQEARRRVATDTGRGMTTIWDHTYDIDDPRVEDTSKQLTVTWPKTYIITSWELRVGIDEKFVETLKLMAEYYDAELVLAPCQASDINYIPEYIKDTFTILKDNVILNDNLQFKYVETHALLQSPLAGHAGAYPDYTTIIPGLVKELRTEPSQHYVKQLISTGSLGYLDAKVADYAENEDDKDFLRKWRTVSTRRHGKPTAIAQNYIVPSALIVDVVDRKTFFTRFITSYKSGVVYDLNKKFTPNGVEESRPSALIMGDAHVYNMDQDAYNATLDMMGILAPKEVVLNDFLDGVSINHHEIGDAVKNFVVPSLREEANTTIDYLAEICSKADKVTYIQSNHDNFLVTWLNMGDRIWRNNRNYDIACGLQFFRTQTQQHPITSLLEFNKFKNLTFVPEEEDHYVGKVLVKHGHEGVSGVRAGFMTLAKVYNYYVQGHTHQPTVFRNAMCVGLIAQLKLGYNIGGSAWLHANGIIQPDNSCQLLPIIQGRWTR